MAHLNLILFSTIFVSHIFLYFCNESNNPRKRSEKCVIFLFIYDVFTNNNKEIVTTDLF